jgi:hypothetical protein
VSPEGEIAALQSELMAAIRQGDRPSCERLIAADFSSVRAGAAHTIEVRLREEWIDDVLRDLGEQVTMTDSVVSQHGPVMVATVLWLEGEKPHSATDIWKRNEAGDWQLTERHAA